MKTVAQKTGELFKKLEAKKASRRASLLKFLAGHPNGIPASSVPAHLRSELRGLEASGDALYHAGVWKSIAPAVEKLKAENMAHHHPPRDVLAALAAHLDRCPDCSERFYYLAPAVSRRGEGGK